GLYGVPLPRVVIIPERDFAVLIERDKGLAVTRQSNVEALPRHLETAVLFVVSPIPQADRIVPGATMDSHDKGLAVGRKDKGTNEVSGSFFDDSELLARGSVPEFHLVTTITGGQHVAVRGKSDAMKRTLVVLQLNLFLPRRHVPELDRGRHLLLKVTP